MDGGKVKRGGDFLLPQGVDVCEAAEVETGFVDGFPGRDAEVFEVSCAEPVHGDPLLPDTVTYYIQVYDEAGNVAEYNFTIAMYLNSSAFIFVILMVIVIAAVAGYIIHKRRHLRIG